MGKVLYNYNCNKFFEISKLLKLLGWLEKFYSREVSLTQFEDS